MNEQEIIKDCIDALKIATEAESENRELALSDLRFAAGEQWPPDIQSARELENRPCLTINKTDAFVRQAVNSMREQRPRIAVHAVSDGASKESADVIAGLIRHIQVNSNADVAYDTGADMQVRIGFGYWRVATRYVRENSFDQEIYVDTVKNPFSVYLDPSSSAPDGSDAEWCIITDRIDKITFERTYPGKKWVDFRNSGAGDSLHDWAGDKEIRVAEFFRVEKVKDTLCMLSNGKVLFKSELHEGMLSAQGERVAHERESVRRSIKWYKLTAMEVLEEREWPGYWIPVIPVYGAEYEIDGKTIRHGMVRHLRDPQKMYNFWRTAETEVVALAPKAPWLVAEGQIEGFEDVWNSANTRSYAYLPYKPVSDPQTGQPMPPPMRQQPQGMPAAQVNAAMGASEDMKAVAGMFDPALGAPGQETSGTMVQQRQKQSDVSNFHFYDNLCRSIRHTGKIILDLIPRYYDTERTIRIIGEDGVPSSVTINQQPAPQQAGQQQQPGQIGAPQGQTQDQMVTKVLNDVTTGEYDVVLDTGPGYQTKREEASDNMMGLLATPLGQKVAMTADDIIMRQFDWPGADQIADRLAAANPLASIHSQLPDDVPDEAKSLIAGLMGKNQQMQQQIQQLEMEQKYRLQAEQVKIQGRMQEVQITDATKRHDIAARDTTARDIEEIKGHVAILLAHMDTRDKREALTVTKESAVD